MAKYQWRKAAAVVAVVLVCSSAARAQDPAPPEQQHDMSKMEMAAPGAWHLMQDGSLYLLFNRQGGERGGKEFKAPNWWMGMASRTAGGGDLTLTGMLSLDPATVGTKGYREIFQVGEALDDRPLVDRQHPHDFFMQLSAAWRTTVRGTGLTLAGGLAGEPALGPVAFMHRASAAAIPFAPLGHHTFDSTHIAFGVATVGVDRGRVAAEASAFNGREPDQRRWDMDFGRMDSVSGRLWFRPSAVWEFQVSSGRLVEPEQLHPGNVVRTTASASYLAGTDSNRLAISAGFGMNATDEVTRHAGFGEVSRWWGRTLGTLRAEVVEVESELLVHGELPAEGDHGAEEKATLGALTLGIVRDVATWKGLTASIGANATLYGVPVALRATHGVHPASAQLFIQLRPPAGGMGRMWNMRMAAPPAPASPHAEHQH